MALRWDSVVVDCRDAAALARWWARTLDWQIVHEDEYEVELRPRHASAGPVAAVDWPQHPQGLVFGPVPEGKTVKNRLHLDLAPHTSQDRDAEIASLLERGATLADVGQGDDVTWTVLRDPEGNEFCVLSSRDR